MTNLESKQLALMLDKLNAFEKREISLANLIAGLEGLFNTLGDADDQWKKAFLKQWGVLEDVQAYALYKTFPTIPQEHMKFVEASITELRALIHRRDNN